MKPAHASDDVQRSQSRAVISLLGVAFAGACLTLVVALASLRGGFESDSPDSSPIGPVLVLVATGAVGGWRLRRAGMPVVLALLGAVASSVAAFLGAVILFAVVFGLLT